MKKFLKLMVFLAIVAIVTGFSVTVVEVLAPPPVLIKGPGDSGVWVSKALNMGQKDSLYQGECPFFFLGTLGEKREELMITEVETDGGHRIPFYVVVERSKIPWISMKVSIDCNGKNRYFYIR